VETKTYMDFTNRSQAAPQQNAQHQNPQFGSTPPPITKKRNGKKINFSRWSTFGLAGIIIVLLIALVLTISFNNPRSQGNYVYTNKLQAVFLNTGQVYFGNVKTINSQYLVLTNIFYLQTNTTSSSKTTSTTGSKVSLVKLGCQLHEPYDQMVINMHQVTFWENLKSTGQVAKAVAHYHKTYPHGQTCSSTSKSTTASGTSSVQNAPTSTSKSATTKP
jgi:hypothetical protein